MINPRKVRTSTTDLLATTIMQRVTRIVVRVGSWRTIDLEWGYGKNGNGNYKGKGKTPVVL